MIPAVLYAAKSTEDKHGSIPDQLADGRKLAEVTGFDVVAERRDEAASAFKGNRGPGLAAAMTEAERLAAEHGSCALIVQHSDRLARGDGVTARHLNFYVGWAAEHRVRLLSVQDPATFTDDPLMAQLMGAIMGLRNAEDSKRKSLAVKDGIWRRAVGRGQYIGGRRPYGYRHRDTTDDGRTTGPLVIVDSEAAIIRRIFGEWVAGRSQSAIARDLQRDGIPTLTPGGSWYATTVAGMLKNPLYVGMVNINGKSHPAVGPDGMPTHEAIIDTDMWEKARQLRQARHARPEGGYKKSGRWTAGRHLLSDGLLRCTCGAAMSPVTKKDKRAANREGYETYVCLKRLHHGPDACSQAPLKRELVDSAVYRYFERVALDEDATRKAFRENAAREIADVDAQLAHAERELIKADARLARVTRGWQDGVIDDAEYSEQRVELSAEREAAEAQAEQHRRRHDEITTAIDAVDLERELAAELTRLRQAVAGQVRSDGQSGVAALRATLRRLFAGFQLTDLATPTSWYGPGELHGTPWAPKEGGKDPLNLDGRYVLMAYIGPHAVDLTAQTRRGSPASGHGALLHSNLCIRLAA